MKLTIEMTEIDYDQYVRLTERNVVFTQRIEQLQDELEELAVCVLKAYQNPESGEPEKRICDSSYLERARELADKVFEKKYRW